MRAGGWDAPTGAALARWARLVRNANALIESPDAEGAALLHAAGAVRRDSFPTHERAAWPFLGAWVAACGLFAQMPPDRRRVNLAGFGEQTEWAVAHMPLLAGAAGGAPPAPSRHWWKD